MFSFGCHRAELGHPSHTFDRIRSITARSSCSPPAVGVTLIFVGTERSTSKCVGRVQELLVC
jgi:hypothetical protein